MKPISEWKVSLWGDDNLKLVESLCRESKSSYHNQNRRRIFSVIGNSRIEKELPQHEQSVLLQIPNGESLTEEKGEKVKT